MVCSTARLERKVIYFFVGILTISDDAEYFCSIVKKMTALVLSMVTALRILILAPQSLTQRLAAVLQAVGEEQVSSDYVGLDADNVDVVFYAELNPEQSDYLARCSALRVPIISTPSAKPLAEHTFSLPDDFYYQDVLELLYRLRASVGVTNQADVGAEPNEDLVGCSAAIGELRRLLRQVADKMVTVLITGPSGSGKEVVARSLHRHSLRSNGPFVPINCGAIPRELLESELFGHERGAFTGAISSRAGRFELAEGGTLFLDEIGDMPLDMQVKILRVIQERQFQRVGSDKTRVADVRIIAATHRDLASMIAAGEFREDLYYRLNVFPLQVPPLAERQEDIPDLIRVLSRQLEADGLGRLRLASSALQSLVQQPWSGNIRELANLLERLVIMYPDQVVGLGDLPESYRCAAEPWREHGEAEQVAGLAATPKAALSTALPEEGLDMKASLQALERSWIEQALATHSGVVSKAAAHLGLRRTTLIEKMRKLEIYV